MTGKKKGTRGRKGGKKAKALPKEGNWELRKKTFRINDSSATRFHFLYSLYPPNVGQQKRKTFIRSENYNKIDQVSVNS